VSCHIAKSLLTGLILTFQGLLFFAAAQFTHFGVVKLVEEITHPQLVVISTLLSTGINSTSQLCGFILAIIPVCGVVN